MTGSNDYGQLGLGDTTAVSTFTLIQQYFFGNRPIIEAGGGYINSLFLTDDGKVYVCGFSSDIGTGLLYDSLTPTLLNPSTSFNNEFISHIAQMDETGFAISSIFVFSSLFSPSDTGNLYTWGFGYVAGNGNGISMDTPFLIPQNTFGNSPIEKVAQVGSFSSASFAFTSKILS